MNVLKRRDFLALTGAVAGTGFATEAAAQVRQNLTQPFSWTFSGLTFSFDFLGNHLRQKYIVPADVVRRLGEPGVLRSDTWSLEVAIQCTGEDAADHHGMKFAGGMPGGRLIFSERREEPIPDGRRLLLVQHDLVLSLRLESYYDYLDGLSVVRRYTRVRNAGQRAVGIEYLSSAMLSNLTVSPDFEKELRIHLPYNSWQAEGQWHIFRPSELGFVPNGEFSLSGVFASTLGTWSTERFLPMAMVENIALGLTWFWQIEHNGSWHWELSNTSARATYVYLGGPDEQHSHAWKNLQPGETYETVPVALGCVHGGFGEAVEQLTRYRRRAFTKIRQARNLDCPVIFNDAIALNLDPTTEKELPLIDAAARAGCEYYVIDAGWYAAANESWWGSVGVWEPSRTRWPDGIKPVLDRIRQKGMTPGMWLEPEVIGINSPLKRKPDDWFFMRHGRRVIDHDRYLLDFRNPAVTAYVESIVARLVDEYGVEYIKWDYNVDGLEGTDLRTESPGQGLLEHNRALLRCLDRILARYPQLVIENCASGGGRMDYAMLSRLQINSSSDQGDYRKYPSITVGPTAGVLLEQSGIWSYPQKSSTLDEASFNMVNAMLCRIHQSGDLASVTAPAFEEVRAGIQIYKDLIRAHIPSSIPFYPLGMPDMADLKAPVCLGIKGPNATFIAVWRLRGAETVRIPIAGQTAALLYPTDLAIKVDGNDSAFVVTFPRQYMACILSLGSH